MDLISSLPTEISIKIFECMNVRDLFNCMTICKSWRNLINSNYVWRRFYSIYDLEELSECEGIVGNAAKEPLSPLCTRAKELKKFVLSPAFNWMSGRCKDFYINLKYREWKAVCHEPYIGVHYMSPNELHVFRCFGHNISRISVIPLTVPGIYDPPILISSKYIVIGAANITAVYKLIEGNFVPYRIFASKGTLLFSNSSCDFYNFTQKHITPTDSVFERVLIDDYLWITDVSPLKQIIDLNTGQKETMKTTLLNTKVALHYHYVLNFAGNEVGIANKTGGIISSFPESDFNKIFCMNAEILAIYYPRLIENGQAPIECREISSGRIVRKIFVHDRTRPMLHPKKLILYLMSSYESIYKITALNIETGDTIWTFEVRSNSFLHFGSFLTVIHERFLVAYPAPANNDCYALFNLKGKLLCERPFINGAPLYLSGGMMLANEDGRLHLISFLCH